MEEFGRKKPSPNFVIRLSQPGIHPWKVPMRALARAMQAVQRIVDQHEEEDEGDARSLRDELQATVPDDASARALRLVDVRNGSAVYGVAAPSHDFAIQMIAAMGKGIGSPDRYGWTAPTLSGLKDLSEIARGLHCDVELRLPGSGKQFGDVLAVITPTTFNDIAPTVYLSGHTSIFAKIERVGGATEMHCGIRLPDQPRKMVICHVASADLVRELGRFMYQRVLLAGEAVWIRHNRQLKRFTVTSFEPPKTGSIRDALERAHRAGGKAWDKFKDPDAKIAEIRGT